MSAADYYIQGVKEAIKRLNPDVRRADIFQFRFTVRVNNVLKHGGIKTMDDILKMTNTEIYSLPNFGRKSARDLMEVISDLAKPDSKIDTHDLLMRNEDLPDYDDDPVVKAILPLLSGSSSNWIGLYLEEYPDHMEYFDRLNIKNEQIYVIERRKLPEEVKNSADNFRFETFLPRIYDTNHLSVLSIAPDWLLNTEIDKTPCSVRLRNVMRNENLVKFSDLLHISQVDFLRMPNFGRRSLRELPDAIIACYKRGMPPSAENLESNQPLKECFLIALEEFLNERQRYIVEKRSGINKKPETLEEIASELGVTRERVRQIEAKAVRTIKISVFWDDILEAKLQTLFEDREEPVYVDKIGTIDPWLDGFEYNAELFIWIAEEFCEKELFILQVEDRKIISNVNGARWSWIKASILRKLRNNLDLEYTMDGIKVLTEYELQELGVSPSLIEVLHDDITSMCEFSHKDDKLILIDIR